MRPAFPLFAIALLAPLALASCAGLKQSKAVLPVHEYEKMIVGRLDAEYVGTDNCVAKCHKHDKIREDFIHSVHGEQVKPQSNLPLVNCESCHGPGSLAIANISDDVASNDARKVKCDTSTFLDILYLPSQAQSLICLKCHSTESTPNLTHWNAGTHALNEVSCLDCHKLHQGPQQKADRKQMSELCFSCHPEIKAENNLFSHHPMREKKMVCVDCHNPHGSTQEKLLLGSTPKETCTRCHMEKQGPFVFEHGDVTEDCMHCHYPHGSVNNHLLAAAMPFLCLQCHGGHLLDSEASKLFLNRCTDCHSQVHGTDIPAPAKAGNGTLRQ